MKVYERKPTLAMASSTGTSARPGKKGRTDGIADLCQGAKTQPRYFVVSEPTRRHQHLEDISMSSGTDDSDTPGEKPNALGFVQPEVLGPWRIHHLVLEDYHT